MGIPFIFDPGQQCTRMSGDELSRRHRRRAHRDLQRLRVRADAQKTGLDVSDVLARAEVLVVTRGEQGSSVFTGKGAWMSCRPARAVSSIPPAWATRSAAG